MKTKKLITIVVVFAMLVVFVFPLSATATSALNTKGSITIKLTDSETENPIANVPFRLYLIAKAYEAENGIEYEMISPYDKAGVDTIDLQDSSLSVHLTYFSSSHSLPYVEKNTNEKGTLVFDNLESSLYLIVPLQSEVCNYDVTPFLISVPTYDSQNEKWEYNIDASPKIGGRDSDEEGETYISVTKKWDTDNLHPENVTVVLLRDFQEYEKVQLNKSNNWHYRWDKIPKKHIWSVVEADVPKGYTAYYETSSNTVTIVNKSEEFGEMPTKPSEPNEDKLVQTGQLNWPVPVCAILGLLFFSIGWAILNLGKKEIK